ncbi:hypothetical protein D9611_007679 [Ephemerocybe angulata]|uniref:Uncharacterized protein n=1 Tax=Ephemerocybe angulata TaxID=980116 RepID=A0A8H5C0A3_9AGAR|nr:hypothetical protein D9611_007679 [Tulosesus angulatus]
MSNRNSQLGTLALQAPSTKPHVVHVTSSTCLNLSLFKDILKEYRRLDDAIVMRLNRANAMARDQERGQGHDERTENAQSKACLSVWMELTENWKRRTKLVDYCISVVDHNLDEKHTALKEQTEDAALQRKTKSAIYEDEVYRRQVHNELSVETIVRKRVVDAFQSRCRYFAPPKSDEETRKIWESVNTSGQKR